MPKKPTPPQFPKIIEGVPFLDAAGPARDWSAAAQNFLKHCAPSNVSIAETEHLLRQL
jgi:hypothetical protein